MNPSTFEQPGVISLSQLRANPKLHSEADEQTQIRIEKGVVEEHLQTYFSKYRIILDDDPPTVGYQDVGINKTVLHTLPAANVVLHRVEMPDAPPDTGSGKVNGKIHSLHLYVHAGAPYTIDALVRCLEIIMKNADQDGRFVQQGAAWAVLVWGLKIVFFEYAGGSLKCMSLEDVQRERTSVSSPVVASMD